MYTDYMNETRESEAAIRSRVAYSLQETALATGNTFSAVYQRVRAGKIPTSRMGRRHLVPASYFLQNCLAVPSEGGKA